MRLFVAIDLPASVQSALTSLIDTLRPTARIRWTKPANLHLTTKFIGEFADSQLAALRDALARVQSPEIPIAVRGIGWFPNPHNPRILWAGVRAPESLGALARATDEAVLPFGIQPEKRAYSPHLTLARIEEKVDLAPLRRQIASLPSDEWGDFTASAFHLYQSELRSGGSIYTRLATFPMPHDPDPEVPSMKAPGV
ncbi:MAG: RNA 2',3'-cyclic phosphodiesterase [Bryobacterales bacterium]|nr:RNA 2',3'-cyclic phosphodiesterase [Bryobacterales bacterium]